MILVASPHTPWNLSWPDAVVIVAVILAFAYVLGGVWRD